VGFCHDCCIHGRFIHKALIYYRGLAQCKLGWEVQARAMFQKLVDYRRAHLVDDVQVDYFAVSLPDFLVFDEDLNGRNRRHCYTMMGLGSLGLGTRRLPGGNLTGV